MLLKKSLSSKKIVAVFVLLVTLGELILPFFPAPVAAAPEAAAPETAPLAAGPQKTVVQKVVLEGSEPKAAMQGPQAATNDVVQAQPAPVNALPTGLTASAWEGIQAQIRTVEGAEPVAPLSPQVAKLTASDGAAGDEFGKTLSVSGDTLVVGASDATVGGNANQGAAYVYMRDGSGTWNFVVKLTASDGAAGDFFGRAVGVSGPTIVVSAYFDADNGNGSGSAYVFENQGGTWTETRKLTASDGASNDYFGHAVAVDGDFIVVGAWGVDVAGNADQGAAYVYYRNEGGIGLWGQAAKLTASDGEATDHFADTVSISGNTVVVGAQLDDDRGIDAGSVYVFDRHYPNFGNWGQVTKLNASDGVTGDRFGNVVAVSGSTIVAGAYFNDDNGTDSGSVYVFQNQSGTWNWDQIAKLNASDGAADDHFGNPVTISGDIIAVGAGLNDDNGIASGSAYIFAPDQGGSLVEIEKLLPNDGAAGDNFGFWVSLSGDMFATGARFADIGGNADQGAAYVFELNHPPVAVDDSYSTLEDTLTGCG